MIAWLKVRVGMTWAEIGETTLPQVRMLAEEFEHVDATRNLMEFIGTALGGKPKRPGHPELPDNVTAAERKIVDERGGLLLPGAEAS